jgi:hypothetical protein
VGGGHQDLLNLLPSSGLNFGLFSYFTCIFDYAWTATANVSYDFSSVEVDAV